MSGPWIDTYSGVKFYYAAPEFRIDDIAHALSMCVRYNGHVRHFYSVAEHSVLVSLLMQELHLGDPLEGLFHDATEAYIADVVSPLKALLPDYKLAESTLEAALRTDFNLPASKTFGCKQADHLALFIESWFLMSQRGAEYNDPHNLRPTAMKLIEKDGWRTVNLAPAEAEAAFLKRWDQLRP